MKKGTIIKTEHNIGITELEVIQDFYHEAYKQCMSIYRIVYCGIEYMIFKNGYNFFVLEWGKNEPHLTPAGDNLIKELANYIEKYGPNK